ncbi:MAG TPA: DUF3747 domain-containing protein [Leptolyngbyaceae cyanobacterium]
MLPLLRRLTPFAVAAATAAAIAPALPTAAAQFEQQDIDQSRIVTIAAPVRNGQFHTLMILEQVSNQRPCWQESGNAPVQIEPLLLNFDFTGICKRFADSNGYSLRIAGQDLGGSYRVEVLRQGSDLVLRASPMRDRATYPPIEIGRANGVTAGFAKLQLNSGWRLTRRNYNGQTLDHIYLTHDAPLNVPIATASGPISQPGTPAPSNPVNPPSGSPLPAIPPQATQPLPVPPPPGSPASSDGTYYRVVVPISGPNTLQQVQAVAPDAFRANVDGQSVIQVGLFRERGRAEQVQRELAQANLSASIQMASAPASTSTPSIPSVPQGQLVVVIDPGHGGRDPGAIGIGGIQEKAINFAISQRVQQRLQQAGITTMMTRSGDQEIDLDPRVVYAERVGADLFVSIHANAISMSRPDVNGLETYYYSGANSERLAQSIHSSILRRTDMQDRGVRTARFYVIRYTSMPAVLVETGFVTGARDAARFGNASTRDQIADAIADGILNYLR